MAHARMSGEAHDVDEPHKFRRSAQSLANSPYEATSRRN